MAINVNTVYQTVLLILNKEQRGYMTPTEFNKISTQVQLEIFEKYFEDLNQQLRVQQTDTDYADRVANLDEKLSIFKTFGDAVYDNTTPTNTYFTLPTTDGYGADVSFYRLGTVTYNNEVELQRLQRGEFTYIDKSPITKPSIDWPVYLYENQKLFVKPKTITSNIQLDYIRKPNNVIWGFTTGNLGQYIYNKNTYDATTQPNGSVQFELHESEQTEIILKILIYAGIVIRDPQIVQIAAQQVQAEEINKKS